MASSISRVYATRADADAAVADLREHGFSASEEIFTVTPPEVPGSNTIVEEIADRIARGYILKRHADLYAKHVADGRWFVSVYAPSGSGFMATVILDRHNPIEDGVGDPVKPMRKYDESAPVSSALQMPVYAADPTPFASFWSVPTLVDRRAPFSDWLGYAAVLNRAAPFSSWIRLPLLADKAELSWHFGLPLTL